MFFIQEGKTAAMMALEGGTHRDGYMCLLLVAAAGVDLEGVDLRHKSHVSFSIFLFFSSSSIQPGPSSLKPRAKYGRTLMFLLKLLDINLLI